MECASAFEPPCLPGHLPLVGWAAGWPSHFSPVEAACRGDTYPGLSEPCTGFAGVGWVGGVGKAAFMDKAEAPRGAQGSCGLGTPALSELCLLPVGREVRRGPPSQQWGTRSPGQTGAARRAQQAPGVSRR